MPLAPPDAILLQRLLNVTLARVPPLRTDGGIGERSRSAIRDFERLLQQPETGADTPAILAAARELATRQGWKEQVAPGGTPPWVSLAEAEDGVREIPGSAGNHPRILGYLATMPGLPAVDETPWCACFVAWCLLRAGVAVPTQGAGAPTAAAASWRQFGTAVSPDQAAKGSIVVLFNQHPPQATTASGFHVGFLVERTGEGVVLRGGNQGDAVNQKLFRHPAWRVEAMRWPG